jgi:hypothetical protein
MRILNDLKLDLGTDYYVRATDIFTDICLKAGVTAGNIGFFGQIRFPGISDLDAIVIGSPEQIRQISDEFNLLLKANLEFRYVFWHLPVYIISEFEDSLPHFHTLNNLNWLAERRHLSTDNDKKLLNVIWYLSLLPTLTEMLRMKERGTPISLRLLLLVYSNLWYSINVFVEDIYEIDPPFVSSDDLRNYVINSKSYDEEYILHSFLQLLDYSFTAFDEYCKVMWENVFIASKAKPFLISAGIRYARSQSSGIINSRLRTKTIELNETGFQIVWDYFQRHSNSSIFQNYINEACRIKRFYSNVHIDYPYIEPFKFSNNIVKREVIQLFNKLNIPKIL